MRDEYIRLDGGVGRTPTFWSSNESWPDAAISKVVQAPCDTAVVIGSANASTIAPLMGGLTSLAFLDLQQGQRDLALSRSLAANDSLSIMSEAERMTSAEAGYLTEEWGADRLTATRAYLAALGLRQPHIQQLESLMVAEGEIFDISRPTSRQHFMSSVVGVERLAGTCGRVKLAEFLLDITHPWLASKIAFPTFANRVGWVHVSNVAMGEYREKMRNASGLAESSVAADTVTTSILDFVGEIPLVDAETVLTYSCYDPSVRHGRQLVPVVHATTLGEAVATELLSEKDLEF